MRQGGDESIVDVVDSSLTGYIDLARATAIAQEYPAVLSSIVSWIRDSANRRDWRRVERLANLAAPLKVPGLGPILRDLIDADISELNKEDVVDILGEIKAIDSASSLFRLAERSLGPDRPAYWLCQKVVLSLSDLGTDEADGYLRAMTAATWPDPIRWHAAVALGIEDELGFEEDRMLGWFPSEE
jgi:hypothetical protein